MAAETFDRGYGLTRKDLHDLHHVIALSTHVYRHTHTYTRRENMLLFTCIQSMNLYIYINTISPPPSLPSLSLFPTLSPLSLSLSLSLPLLMYPCRLERDYLFHLGKGGGRIIHGGSILNTESHTHTDTHTHTHTLTLTHIATHTHTHTTVAGIYILQFVNCIVVPSSWLGKQKNK